MTMLDIVSAFALVSLLFTSVAICIVVARMPDRTARRHGHSRSRPIKHAWWYGALLLAAFVAYSFIFSRQWPASGAPGDFL